MVLRHDFQIIINFEISGLDIKQYLMSVSVVLIRRNMYGCTGRLCGPLQRNYLSEGDET
ncbi:MAG: hypothetical protein QG577_2357 [Thermodesulfobacteriota bacterium]|nr:hypothetical protein [Thermodesulfobacteriota bacterium]